MQKGKEDGHEITHGFVSSVEQIDNYWTFVSSDPMESQWVLVSWQLTYFLQLK